MTPRIWIEKMVGIGGASCTVGCRSTVRYLVRSRIGPWSDAARRASSAAALASGAQPPPAIPKAAQRESDCAASPGRCARSRLATIEAMICRDGLSLREITPPCNGCLGEFRELRASSLDRVVLAGIPLDFKPTRFKVLVADPSAVSPSVAVSVDLDERRNLGPLLQYAALYRRILIGLNADRVLDLGPMRLRGSGRRSGPTRSTPGARPPLSPRPRPWRWSQPTRRSLAP